jgi:hypothetical protein
MHYRTKSNHQEDIDKKTEGFKLEKENFMKKSVFLKNRLFFNSLSGQDLDQHTKPQKKEGIR